MRSATRPVFTNGRPLTLKHGWPNVVACSAPGNERAIRSTSAHVGTHRSPALRLHLLEHVRAIAFEYDRTAGGSVARFVDEIERRRSEPDDVEPALFDETQDAVRILTVHGAKGLEFETVILPDLQFGSSGADAYIINDPPSLVLRNGVRTISGYARRSGERPLSEIAKLREDAENRRLRDEVSQLRERIKVLERITVEKENSLSRQIEELRDR